MSFLSKQSLYILIGIALALNYLGYVFTLDRPGYGTQTGPFTDGIERIFYIGEKTGHNFYTAGFPFQSHVTRFDDSDGCPCQDVSKPEVILGMIPTYEFLANTLVWSVVPAIYLVVRKKSKSLHLDVSA